MLGHGREESACGFERPVDLGQHRVIFLDVLQHVEGTDDIELLPIWDVSSVHLRQPGRRHARRRELEAGREYLAAVELDRGSRLVDAAEDEARSATDLEKRADLREVP